MKYLNTAEVCKLLHVSPVTLWRYRRDGVVPFFKIKGKVLYRQSDINAIIDNMVVNLPIQNL